MLAFVECLCTKRFAVLFYIITTTHFTILVVRGLRLCSFILIYFIRVKAFNSHSVSDFIQRVKAILVQFIEPASMQFYFELAEYAMSMRNKTTFNCSTFFFLLYSFHCVAITSCSHKYGYNCILHADPID